MSRDIPHPVSTPPRWSNSRQGVHAQRILATMTSKTGALAVDIASDKGRHDDEVAGLQRNCRAEAGDGARPTARSPRLGASGIPSSSGCWTATTDVVSVST